MLRNALAVRSLIPRPSGLPIRARLRRSVIAGPGPRTPRCLFGAQLGSGGLRPSKSRSFELRTAAISSADDTIYALSSAPGKAGIAVIRISGVGCLDVYHGLCPSSRVPEPRYAAVRTLYHPSRANGHEAEALDSNALVLYFPGPRSVTGEDVLELHVHGGAATVRAVLSALPASASGATIRYAEPGEFTRRAFLNGRLDLAQVESLSDTLAAETEQQRRAAVRGSSGKLGRTYDDWRHQLLLARGEIEALIDFSEDQHFDESPSELLANVRQLVGGILRAISMHEAGSQRSELLRNGIRIALLGPPNVGKSSLMNLVVGREASIVSPEAGTTRDIVEASLDIRGYLCSFADTAGFRSSRQSMWPPERISSRTRARGSATPVSDPEAARIGAVEQEGMRRAKQRALSSDFIVALASVEVGLVGSSPSVVFDLETLQLAAGAPQRLIVLNKQDAVSQSDFGKLLTDFKTSVLQKIPGLESAEVLGISCKHAEGATSGEGAEGQNPDPGGIHGFIDALTNSFASLTELPMDMQDLLGVTERQRQLLVHCRTHLEDFMLEAHPREEGPGRLADETFRGKAGDSDGEPDIVLAAEHLRFAAMCLARITGRGEGGDVEEVLGVIFEKFCVGK